MAESAVLENKNSDSFNGIETILRCITVVMNRIYQNTENFLPIRNIPLVYRPVLPNIVCMCTVYMLIQAA